jgi:signal transduction histidine kinase
VRPSPPRDAFLLGPIASAHHRQRVLALATPIFDPENPDAVIGALLALYDWTKLMTIAADVSRDLAATGLAVDLLIANDAGIVIGSAAHDGSDAFADHDLARDGWQTRTLPVGANRREYAYEPAVDALVGRVRLHPPVASWLVFALEPRTEALLPIRRMRLRLLAALAVVLTAGVAGGDHARPPHDAAVAVSHRRRSRSSRATPRDRHCRSARTTRSASSPKRFNGMADDLRRAQRDLVSAAKLASVGEIAAGLAHEIRTPLGIMRGSAQMLGRSAGGDPRRTGRARRHDRRRGRSPRTRRGGAHRSSAARTTRRSRKRCSRRSLQRAVEFVSGQAASQHVVVTSNFAAPCLALCDPEQVYQVALNLLVNALHVLPRGGRIEVRTFGPDHGQVGFEVADDGPGIAPELQAEIFTPFFTRREGGTGLGLAFVERVAIAHQGRVSVRSTPGAGATFRVELPAAEGRP